MAVIALTIRIYKVLSLNLLLLTLASISLYSTVSTYIEASLVNMVNPPLDPPMMDGLTMVNLYNGIALTPITGLLDPGIASKLREVEGLIVWFEVTTPALVNGTPVIVRGVESSWSNFYKPQTISGKSFDPEAIDKAWLGVELAERFNVKPGGVIVVKPLFTNVDAILEVAGVIDAPQPYRYEILVPLGLGYALRGSINPSTIRIAYDPSIVNESILWEVLGGAQGVPAGAARVVSALIYKGYVRLEGVERAQRYYMERLGVPYEAVIVLAITANIIVSLLNITSAWLVYAIRRRSFTAFIEQGVSFRTLRLSIIIALAPIALAGSLLGIIIATHLEPLKLLSYPIGLELGAQMIIAHLITQLALYILGLITGGISER